MAKMKYCGNHKQRKKCAVPTAVLIAVLIVIILLLIFPNQFIILANYISLIIFTLAKVILFVLFIVAFVFHPLIIKCTKIREECKSLLLGSFIFEGGLHLIKILNCPCPYTIMRYLLDDPFLFDIEDNAGNFKEELDRLSKSDCISISEDCRRELQRSGWILLQSDSESISKDLRGKFAEKYLKLPKTPKVWAIEQGNKWKIQAKGSPYIIEQEGGKLKVCRENYFFVDTWVLFQLFLAIVIFIFWSSIPYEIWFSSPYKILGVVAIAFGIFRVYEYLIYQTYVVLFALEEKKRKARESGEETPPIILNPYRILILSILGYVNVIIWFAVFYLYIEPAFSKPLDWFSSLNYSFVTMTSFGKTNIVLACPYGIISLIQSAMGLFLIILIIANFVASLPKPDYYD